MLCLGAGSIPVGSLNPKPNWYFLNYIITSQSSSHGMLCLGAGLIPVGLMNPKPNLYFRNHIITLVLDIIHTIMTGELQTPKGPVFTPNIKASHRTINKVKGLKNTGF